MAASIMQRLDKFLNEKNILSDILGKIESKTGIKKTYIALGESGRGVLALIANNSILAMADICRSFCVATTCQLHVT